MFDKTKLTIDTCKSAYKRWRTLGTKLVRNPFFPLLFISEVVKVATLAVVQTGPFLTPTLTALTILAVISTVVWIFAEELLEEVTETIEEVTDEK